MLLLLPALVDKRWELKLNVVAKITLSRILLPWHAPDTGWLWSCMTSLFLPTRWIFSLSVNLLRLQVDAEIRGSGEYERDRCSEETEVLCSNAENNTNLSIPFWLFLLSSNINVNGAVYHCKNITLSPPFAGGRRDSGS